MSEESRQEQLEAVLRLMRIELERAMKEARTGELSVSAKLNRGGVTGREVRTSFQDK